jgi:hypothetical protein
LIASPVRAKLSGVEFQNYTKNKCVLGLFFATQILEINIIFTISVQKLNKEHQGSLRPEPSGWRLCEKISHKVESRKVERVEVY